MENSYILHTQFQFLLMSYYHCIFVITITLLLTKFKSLLEIHQGFFFFFETIPFLFCSIWSNPSDHIAFMVVYLNCGAGEDSWESLGLQGDPTSPS